MASERTMLTLRTHTGQPVVDEIEWSPVPTHPGYSASKDGRVRGPRGSVLRPMAQPDTGHLYVLTPRPRKPRKLFVHRAVLLAFVGPQPDGHEGRHLDGDPANNRLGNLKWGTRLQNMADKKAHGREWRGEDKPGARLTESDVAAIRVDTGSSRVVGRRFGVSHTAVQRIRRGERWRQPDVN